MSKILIRYCAASLTIVALGCANGGPKDTPNPAPDPKPLAADAELARRLVVRGKELSDGGEYMKAIAVLGRAIVADRHHGEAHLLKAQAHLFIGHEESAVGPLLARAVELRPTDPEAHLLYGHELVRAENPSKALSHFERALALAPRRVDIRLDLAHAQQVVGDVESALRTLEVAVREQPKNIQARVRVAELLTKQKKHAEAARALEAAAREINTAALYRRAGDLYAEAGDEGSARRVRAKADELDPPAKKRRLRKLPPARTHRR